MTGYKPEGSLLNTQENLKVKSLQIWKEISLCLPKTLYHTELLIKLCKDGKNNEKIWK
jgi:hypothetical protein